MKRPYLPPTNLDSTRARHTRWLIALCLLVLCISKDAEAQWNTSIHWGFMRANAIHLEPTLTGLTSGSTFLYGDWDVGYVANDKVSIHVGVGGFAAESTVLTSISGVPVTLKIEPTVITFPLFARVALNDPGQTVRAFLEGGPSISSVEADLSTGLPPLMCPHPELGCGC
jgi:hypothetical protein